MLWAAQEAWAGFAALGEQGLRSGLLRRLALGPSARAMAEPLQALQSFCDWEEAAELGRIVPRPGADSCYDVALAQVGRPVQARGRLHTGPASERPTCLGSPCALCAHCSGC